MTDPDDTDRFPTIPESDHEPFGPHGYPLKMPPYGRVSDVEPDFSGFASADLDD